MIKLAISAAAALLLTLPAAAQRASSDDSFSVEIQKINESVSKIAAARAKRSQQPQAPAQAPMCTPAQIDQAYQDVGRCEASIKKSFGVNVRDVNGVLNKGFTRDGLSLVLLTTTDAFFYHEDCDICAAVERCSLKDGSITNFKTAHSVDCADLAPFLKTGVVYSSCPLKP